MMPANLTAQYKKAEERFKAAETDEERLDALEALKAHDCDLVYADPPYITQFGTNDYEANLHFVEGLMTMWEGKQLNENAKRDYESGTHYTRKNIGELIEGILSGNVVIAMNSEGQ